MHADDEAAAVARAQLQQLRDQLPLEWHIWHGMHVAKVRREEREWGSAYMSQPDRLRLDYWR